MPDDDAQASTLGERLLMGVRNLWSEVHRHDKVLDQHGRDIEDLRRRLAALESEAHGLRISRGRARAKSARLEAALAESAETLAAIKAVIH
jgi:septal ring factor EnvC (AmiA/AmiB activator)